MGKTPQAVEANKRIVEDEKKAAARRGRIRESQKTAPSRASNRKRQAPRNRTMPQLAPVAPPHQNQNPEPLPLPAPVAAAAPPILTNEASRNMDALKTIDRMAAMLAGAAPVVLAPVPAPESGATPAQACTARGAADNTLGLVRSIMWHAYTENSSSFCTHVLCKAQTVFSLSNCTHTAL